MVGGVSAKQFWTHFSRFFYLKKFEICFGGSLGVLEMYSEKKEISG